MIELPICSDSTCAGTSTGGGRMIELPICSDLLKILHTRETVHAKFGRPTSDYRIFEDPISELCPKSISVIVKFG